MRILFSGLISFIPSQDGTELTVLLLKAGHTHHLSDGSALPDHNPVLVARAGTCSGDCTSDTGVPQKFFPDQSTSVAQDSFDEAVNAGLGWTLNGELSVSKGSSSDPNLPSLSIVENVRTDIIPTTSEERKDFAWVANMNDICSTCTLDSDVLATQPPSGLIAARLRLHNGNVFTYSVARIGSNVAPVHFKRLDGTGSASSYSQAIASWVAADIEVSGDSIEISETPFAGGTGRSMTLAPDESGKVEIALLNLPAFVPPASANNDAPQVGKHFERYYDLADTPPAIATRLVPRAGAISSSVSYPEVEWSDVHPSNEVWSELLNKLRLDIGRSVYDRTLCPPVNGP